MTSSSYLNYSHIPISLRAHRVECLCFETFHRKAKQLVFWVSSCWPSCNIRDGSRSAVAKVSLVRTASETSLPPPQSEAGAGLTFATALLGSGPEASCSSPQPLSCASSRELST